MKTYKAFVKLNGEVGSKEIPGIEYIDKNYYEKVQKRQQELKDLLSKRNITESVENKRNESADNVKGEPFGSMDRPKRLRHGRGAGPVYRAPEK
jgi:hypothetical protein